ncbi:MAG: hypothetical protein A3F75_01010 [Betaproteobacteria bacterium RIFCSPLOWO2_12_FULL_64_23]|nr:MAG: hypothetical protein A3F75_01010 [Betaproteobacteria bacterium RIFCSPLOWO2_12_FULL_64_23]
MTAVDDKEPFLSRWSRRKLEAKETPPASAPAADLPATAPGAAAAPATEPAAPGAPQGTSAEYREYFDPRVDEELRRTALKQLFSDPQFNVMDGLDTYIDDYSIADPIPEAMLRQLNQAKNLFLFEDEGKGKTAESAGGPAAVGEAAAPVAAVDTSALPETSAAGDSDKDAQVATSAAAAPPAQGSKNN